MGRCAHDPPLQLFNWIPILKLQFFYFFFILFLSVLPGFVYKRRRLDLVFCCCYFPSLLCWLKLKKCFLFQMQQLSNNCVGMLINTQRDDLITWKGRTCIFAILNFEENITGIRESIFIRSTWNNIFFSSFVKNILLGRAETFGRTHWARNFVGFFSFRLLSVLPGFVYKRRRLDLVFCCCCYFPSLLYWLRTGHL
jgi:hypothetical protein